MSKETVKTMGYKGLCLPETRLEPGQQVKRKTKGASATFGASRPAARLSVAESKKADPQVKAVPLDQIFGIAGRPPKRAACA